MASTCLASSSRIPPDSIPAATLYGFEALVRRLGGNPTSLAEQSGIEGSFSSDSYRPIAVKAVAALLESAARELNCPDFGMQLAEEQRDSRFNKGLERVMRNASSYREAVDVAKTFSNAFTRAVRTDFAWLPSLDLYVQFHVYFDDVLLMAPQLSEQLLLIAHNSALSLSSGFVYAYEVWFPHRRISPQAAYRSRFKAPVKFGQDHSALVFKPEIFERSLIGADPSTYRSELSSIARTLPVDMPGFALLVRETIKILLMEGEWTREQVASRLGINPRTLNKRLAISGLSFEILRDDLRRDTALRCLAHTDLSLTEIASRLGYSELAVFTRSCRRWFSHSPSSLRRRLRASDWWLNQEDRPSMLRNCRRVGKETRPRYLEPDHARAG